MKTYGRDYNELGYMQQKLKLIQFDWENLKIISASSMAGSNSLELGLQSHHAKLNTCADYNLPNV